VFMFHLEKVVYHFRPKDKMFGLLHVRHKCLRSKHLRIYDLPVLHYCAVTLVTLGCGLDG
jgi:hypothetical protein